MSEKKTYVALVKDKSTGKFEILTYDYHSKKDFAIDIRANGYAVRFISTPEKFDEDCEKWNRNNEAVKRRKRIIIRSIRECDEKCAAAVGKTLNEYRKWKRLWGL